MGPRSFRVLVGEPPRPPLVPAQRNRDVATGRTSFLKSSTAESRTMRLDTSQQMRTDMRLRMAPRMIQSMEILQLPLMALQERIDQELSENPVLVDLREAPAPEVDSEEAAAAPQETITTEFEGEVDGEGADEWAEMYGEMHRPSRAALSEEADRKHDAMQNMASRPHSLHDDLSAQLAFLDPDPAIRALAEYIISNLD